MTTAPTKKVNKMPNPNENKDAILLAWNNVINKWYAIYDAPVSKKYWEWVYNTKVEFGVPFCTPDTKARTKFIRVGEAIN